jgi:large subunit ribosomal protein L5
MSGTKNQKGKAGGKAKTAAPRGAGGPPAGKEAQRAARRVALVGVDNPVAAAPEMPRLQKRYREEVRAKLRTEFDYKNEMQIPKLDKIVINMGLGEATQNTKLLDPLVGDLTTITGQKPVTTKAKKSIAAFKVREGMPIGAMVTLRGDIMYEFLDRLISVALPRVRDFRGVSTKSFDGRGNYTLGMRDQLIFPEVDYARVEKLKGMNVTIVTTAKDDNQARALLRQFGIPFRQTA